MLETINNSPDSQPETAPRSQEIREAELEVLKQNAAASKEWYDKLSNPGLLKRFGRRALNAFGIISPEQKALKYHERILGNYDAAESPKLPGEMPDLSQPAATVEEPSSTQKFPGRDEVQSALDTVHHNGLDAVNARISVATAAAKQEAASRGEYFSQVDAVDLREQMLRESIAQDLQAQAVLQKVTTPNHQ